MRTEGHFASLCLALGSLVGTGCMASGTQLTRERAAFDFNCPQEKVDVPMVSGMSERGTGSVFGARGCGKRATYIRHEQAGMTLNSPVSEDK
jgi:hypothetical protein